MGAKTARLFLDFLLLIIFAGIHNGIKKYYKFIYANLQKELTHKIFWGGSVGGKKFTD